MMNLISFENIKLYHLEWYISQNNIFISNKIICTLGLKPFKRMPMAL